MLHTMCYTQKYIIRRLTKAMRAALRLAPITIYMVIRAKCSAARETSVKLPFSYDCLTCGLSVTPCPGTPSHTGHR